MSATEPAELVRRLRGRDWLDNAAADRIEALEALVGTMHRRIVEVSSDAFLQRYAAVLEALADKSASAVELLRIDGSWTRDDGCSHPSLSPTGSYCVRCCHNLRDTPNRRPASVEENQP